MGVTIQVQFVCDGIPPGNRDAVPCPQKTEIGGTATLGHRQVPEPMLPNGWKIVRGHYLCDLCSKAEEAQTSDQFPGVRFQY
jgi:hypothetical protein